MSYLDRYVFELSTGLMQREWGALMTSKRIIKPRIWIFMMSMLVLVFGCVYISQGQFIERQDLRIDQLEMERAQRQDANAQLERQLEFTKTQTYVERIAHEELGLLKEGEIRFVSGTTPDLPAQGASLPDQAVSPDAAAPTNPAQ
ncbi:MAG: septum formation initiator family protein [Clostridia bacterium]